MRTFWEALHRDLVRSLNTLTARKTFDDIKEQHRELKPYRDAGALIEHLHWRDEEYDTKDRIYAALVTRAQRGGQVAELATSLLWLGLWPALDRTYRRQLRNFKAEPPGALVSEIGARFTREIHRADLGCIHRVASTLTMNVERDVREGVKRRWRDERLRADLPGDGDDAEGSTRDRRRARRSPHLQTRGISELGLPPRIDVDGDVRALREVLVEVVGDDAELVIGVVIRGESQREVGERLGLRSHEAARKRYQRAIARIREHFEVQR